MKKHKSGALKRKEQEQRKNHVASCVPLTNFFPATQPSVSGKCLSAASSRQATEKEHAATYIQERIPDDEEEEEKEDDDDSGEDEGNNGNFDDAAAELRAQTTPLSANSPPDTTEGHPTSVDFLLNTEQQYPTDPYFFQDKPLTPELIRALIEHGPCQPGLKDSYAFPYDDIKDASVLCGINAL